MNQPYDRVYNFSAGPCTLPVEVLEEAREDLLNYKGMGMSVMEMSHRSKPFEAILAQAEADLKKLLKVPDNYKILFLQGGATMQFSMIPLCFLGEGKSADYMVTGAWGEKAFEAAALVGNANLAYSGKAANYNDIPKFDSIKLNSDAAYVHFTSNETIHGVQFHEDPTVAAPLICDMSSDIISRPVDVSKYALIYAGAQKNMGPAGVTVVIIRDDLLERIPAKMHPILDYKLHAKNTSMYNTPPCWSIYMCGLVYKYILHHGGVAGAHERNLWKSKVIYQTIDGTHGFFKGHAEHHARSTMNVTFTLPNDELTTEFVKEAEALKLDGLKGHRSVGGIRASIYNAFPLEGCQALAKFMWEFATKHA
ncbi:MAG: phosphoserine transaminase [Fimbriimonas sp.]|nr:phosphoserine transaminase [Fimbriimonas sp.]